MRDKACGNAAHTLGTIVFLIAISINFQWCFLINSIVLDVMVLIIQCVSIGFDLCIKGTQVLAGSVVYINVICRAGWIIVVVQCLACYQLVRSRSICGSSGRAFREFFCAKSLAPGVFAVVLSFCRGAFIFDRLFVVIKLHVAVFIGLIDLDVVTDIGCIFFSILLQLFHDNHVVVINTVCDFDEAIIVSRIIFLFFNSCYWLAIVIPCAISIH